MSLLLFIYVLHFGAILWLSHVYPQMSVVHVSFPDTLFFKSVVRTLMMHCLLFLLFLNRSIFTTLSCLLSLQFCTSFYSVCPLVIFLFPTVVSGSGGEVVPTGRDALPEGKAESLRLSGRFHHCHHWQEAAAVAESDGAASGGELQVQKLTYRIAVENLYIIDIYII